jgi:hypothetical protein
VGGGGEVANIELNMQCDDQILINIVFVLCVTGINYLFTASHKMPWGFSL